jgi:hypothetical protein
VKNQTMKIKLLLFFALLLPVAAYCQSINMPAVGYSEDHLTTIAKVEVTNNETVVTFNNILPHKGSWVQLNKSVYLQDAGSEERYNYIRSEGIPLRPDRFTADKNGQVVEFKVYFEKLKPGTKAINVIERARSAQEQAGSVRFFNFYNVSLNKSATVTERVKVTDVVLMPPPPIEGGMQTITDTAYAVSGSNPNAMMNNFAPMMGNMYTSMLDAQLNLYSKPETTKKLARITKNYYDALIKAGFSAQAALKIVTSRPLVSMDGMK